MNEIYIIHSFNIDTIPRSDPAVNTVKTVDSKDTIKDVSEHGANVFQVTTCKFYKYLYFGS